MSTVETQQPPKSQESIAVERVGRCSICRAFTYDVSGLTEEVVRRLVLETEGRVLNQLVRRRDGRVMSVDCGHSSLRRRVSPTKLFVFALVGALVALGAWVFPRMREVEPAHPEPAEPILSVKPVFAAPGALEPMEHEPSAAVSSPVLVNERSSTRATPVTEDRASALEVHFANVSVWGNGTIPSAQVVVVLEANTHAFQQCYLETLDSQPDYRGSVDIAAFLDKRGRVSSSNIDGSVLAPTAKASSSKRQPVPPALRSCLAAAIAAMELPRWESRTLSFKAIFDGRK